MTFYIFLFPCKIKIKIVAGLISAGPACAVPVVPTLLCLANTVAADLPFLLILGFSALSLMIPKLWGKKV